MPGRLTSLDLPSVIRSGTTSASPWIDEPDEELEAFIEQVPVGRALDLGMGEGRNALWLAARGFEVVGVDLSPEVVAQADQRARERHLSIETHVADIRTFPIEPRTYSLILASAVLHFLLPREVRALARRIQEGLCPGGVLMASVFTVDDPGYEALQERRTEHLAENTYYVPEFGGPMHYFAPGELRGLFQGLEILYYAEERQLDTTHDLPHYHSGAFLVARRQRTHTMPGATPAATGSSTQPPLGGCRDARVRRFHRVNAADTERIDGGASNDQCLS